MKKCAQIIIGGKVQNVGFRFNTQVIAKEYNITGYVKNLPDGSVFIEAEGEESNLKEFIECCRKGPVWSQVDNIDLIYKPFNGYLDFVIR